MNIDIFRIERKERALIDKDPRLVLNEKLFKFAQMQEGKAVPGAGEK